MKAKYLFLGFGLFVAASAFAEPTDYIYLPAVEYGEKEIDFKYGSARTGSDRDQAASIGFGYGATQRWFTEAYLKYARPSGEGTAFDAIEWENKFQLTETGEYPVDVGLITEIEITKRPGDPNELKWGPLFQTDLGKLQLNGNLLFMKRFGRDDVSSSHPVEFGYQWQVKYRATPAFQYGFQGFGETGKWNDWVSQEEQNHRLGPAVFGKVALGNRQVIKYNAAWLLGASQAAPGHILRAQVEYEF